MAEAIPVAFGIQAVGQYMSSQDEARANREAAKQAVVNAQKAKEQAKFDAEKQSIESRKTISQTETGYAAAGVEGQSAMAVLMDSMANAEMDRLSIIYGGDVRSENFLAQASQYKSAANASEQAGLFGVLSSGLKIFGNSAGTKKNQNVKVFGGSPNINVYTGPDSFSSSYV